MPIDDRVKSLLLEVVEHFDKEDRSVRERQLRTWKKLKFYWNNIQQTWWSEVAHDWRTFDIQNIVDSYKDSAYYDKPINVFRAYLESIFAALSVTTPVVQCYPDDADSPIDLSTAKVGDYISKLIYKHNDAPLLWLHALYIFGTEGLTCAYNYTKEDKKYGTYEQDSYEDEEQTHIEKICPICNTNLSDVPLSNQQRDRFDPEETDNLAGLVLSETEAICPQCLGLVQPKLVEEKFIVPKFVGKTTHPKSRQCIEVYGGLNIKVPIWARSQSECPYLIYAYETHYANVLAQYSDLRSSLTKKQNKDLKDAVRQGGMYDPYEQNARLSTQYLGEYPESNVTVRNAWLRPCAFEVLKQEDAEFLKAKYPLGCKVILANEYFADVQIEALDDHWTLLYNPLSDYIYFDPIGLLLTSVQDITNELISLTLQTIEHGITQTFVDPNVVNFEQYRQNEIAPGSLIPAKPAGGKALGDAFYEIKTATLSGEVLPFGSNIQELGQLASGAQPSLFGGEGSGSKTASEYTMSRNQSLQRLQTTWKMLSGWWKQVFGKVIPAYIKDVAEDERYVERDADGNFVNVFIKQADLQGKIGSVELESSEELPTSWQQKRDVVMQLLNGGAPIVMQTMMSPENLPLIAKSIGLEDLVVPGMDDRQKQYEEIQVLSQSEPISVPGGMPSPESPDGMIEEPSVDIDPLIDNHQIHADICRIYLVSQKGRQLKIESPSGYKNVLLHMQRHIIIAQVMMASAAPPSQPNDQSSPAAQGTRNGQPESITA